MKTADKLTKFVGLLEKGGGIESVYDAGFETFKELEEALRSLPKDDPIRIKILGVVNDLL